ncbi:MAG: 1-acyl-sn-glycerol-3-phosphate acyltransferase [Firmicutes bacterium]|jgi:1-acyl-sn-glycerol-3-phosphate acyltransferase|nr:1-acyl-sn-glycerol-3-phosphate acyltransferase [Bacillota bacterium]
MKHGKKREEGGALYNFGLFLFSLFYLLIYRMKVTGRENVPWTGPLIVCSNHINWFDPTLVARAIGKRRQVCFMAKAELFDIPYFGNLISKLGAFPVKREEADRRALLTALSILDQGKAVGLFPEGTRSRSGQLLKAFDGPAFIILKSGAPVLPVAIKGPYRLFRPIRINIGKPIFVDFEYERESRKARREKIKEVSKLVMENIEGLLEDAV